MLTFPTASSDALGAVAQLVARLVRNEKVRGSNPLSSTTSKPRPTCRNTAGGAGFRRRHAALPVARAPSWAARRQTDEPPITRPGDAREGRGHRADLGSARPRHGAPFEVSALPRSVRRAHSMSEGSAGLADQPDAQTGVVRGPRGRVPAGAQELERAVLPLATSVDGRQFTFQASLHGLALQTGGYVVLEGDGQPRLGQILTMRPDSMSVPDVGLGDRRPEPQVRVARGEGVILDGDGQTFHDALVRPATPAEVDAWFVRVRPDRSALDDRRAAARARGRRSARCRRLQPAYLHVRPVRLRQDVLAGAGPRTPAGGDQSADDHPRPQLRLRPPGGGARHHRPGRCRRVRRRPPSGVSVWRNDPDAARPLRLQFAEVDAAAQAAVLGLDPIRDREEYAALSGILAAGREGPRR